MMVNTVAIVHYCHCQYHNRYICCNFCIRVSMDVCFETVKYLSTLLIILLRIADSSFQWQVVSLAIILSGLSIFSYATVLP